MKRQLGWVSVVALALAFLSPAAPVYAHANLVQAAPPDGAVLGTAPARIDLVFDEELDTDGSQVRVYDATGARVDRDDLQVAGKRMTIGVRDVPVGVYRVRWVSVADEDKEAVRGSSTFRVGPPAAGQPQLGVSPGHGDAGQLITIGGSGFGPEALVLVAIGDEQRGLAPVRTDGQGRFALQTLVPESLAHGRQVVQAVNLDGRMATAALQVDRGGWPPLGAELHVESEGMNRLGVEIQLVNRSGWHLRNVEVRAAIPPGARVLRAGLEGPEGVDGVVRGNQVVWSGAVAPAHTYLAPFGFVLDTAGVTPGTPLRPTVTVSFEHGAPPLFRDHFTVGSSD
jgi:methionine-rich copper-binding protein CopC